jgi:hypothetical protein
LQVRVHTAVPQPLRANCGACADRVLKGPGPKSASALARDPGVWLERLYSEIAAGKDWPLVQVPRERYDNFHESARIKTWSFMLWLVARYPERWPRLLEDVSKPNQLPEDVAAAFREVLERDVGEIEAQWRKWARSNSRIGKASGLGR